MTNPGRVRSRIATLALLTLSFVAAAAAQATLTIYFIDVEGGQATLIISPTRESMLVDTGFSDLDGRDAGRIAAVLKEAGINRLDDVFITHYHNDHVGGVPALLQRVKVGTFFDHGENRENAEQTRGFYSDYLKTIAGSKHVVVKPGDEFRLGTVRIHVAAADGTHPSKPLTGGGQPNPFCKDAPTAEADASENARSAGFLLTAGKFRFLDLGDLTIQKELDLVCPNNLIGTADVFLVSHHGNASSNSRPLVDAVHPRVAIMNNGPRKGGQPAAWQVVHDSPGLEDLWQLHYAVGAGADHNVPEQLIANPEEHCEAKYLKLTAHPDGSFDVTNSRNGFTKHYAARH